VAELTITGASGADVSIVAAKESDSELVLPATSVATAVYW
jgi:hypothetical protein